MHNELLSIGSLGRLRCPPDAQSKAFTAALIIALADEIAKAAPDAEPEAEQIIRLVRRLYGRLPSRDQISQAIFKHLPHPWSMLGGSGPAQLDDAADAVLRLLEDG
jgi:hypothetical protein